MVPIRLVDKKYLLLQVIKILTENIIHLVIARATDSPAGTKGISLFLVPKFIVNEDGSIGA